MLCLPFGWSQYNFWWRNSLESARRRKLSVLRWGEPNYLPLFYHSIRNGDIDRRKTRIWTNKFRSTGDWKEKVDIRIAMSSQKNYCIGLWFEITFYLEVYVDIRYARMEVRGRPTQLSRLWPSTYKTNKYRRTCGILTSLLYYTCKSASPTSNKQNDYSWLSTNVTASFGFAFTSVSFKMLRRS